MDEILLLLFKLGAAHRSVARSTLQIGTELRMSQQNASRRLIELEREGSIERSHGRVRLTEKGVVGIRQLYGELKTVLEPARSDAQPLTFRGKIVDGFREGAYYLSFPGYQKPLERSLGFTPFPGTLNLRLEKEEVHKKGLLTPERGMFIPGFEWKNRSLGGLHIYPCRIGRIHGAIIHPVRTHHGNDILELVAPVSIKKKLKKKAGDMLTVSLVL